MPRHLQALLAVSWILWVAGAGALAQQPQSYIHGTGTATGLAPTGIGNATLTVAAGSLLCGGALGTLSTSATVSVSNGVNYVYINQSTGCGTPPSFTASTGQSGFQNNQIPIAVVQAGGCPSTCSITSILDVRPWAVGRTGPTWLVTDFGAKGDGMTDDAAAFNAAFSAATTTGGIVYAPPGNYRVTSQLNVPDNITVQGAGSNSTTIVKSFNGVLMTMGSGAGLVDVSLEGSAPSGYTGGNLLLTGTAGGQFIHRSQIVDSLGPAVEFWPLGGSQSSWIDDNIWQYGAGSGSNRGKYSILISDPQLRGEASTGSTSTSIISTAFGDTTHSSGYYNGITLGMTSGTLAGQTQVISASTNNGTGSWTFTTSAFTGTPSAGDWFALQNALVASGSTATSIVATDLGDVTHPSGYYDGANIGMETFQSSPSSTVVTITCGTPPCAVNNGGGSWTFAVSTLGGTPNVADAFHLLVNTAVPRNFVTLFNSGFSSFDFGMSNGTSVSGGGYIGDMLFSTQSRDVLISGMRVGALLPINIFGYECSIVGSDVGPQILIAPTTGAITIAANTYNQVVPIINNSSYPNSVLLEAPGLYSFQGSAPASSNVAGTAAGTTFTLTSPAGGATTGSYTTGGSGGDFSLTTGAGGSGSGGTSANGGRGGNFSLTLGAGGTASSGGSAGVAGIFSITGGNVGIGTTSPGYLVDVVGGSARVTNPSGTTQLTVSGSATSGRFGQDSSGLFLSSDTNGAALRFGTNNGSGHEWMRITSAGNVGIGTTTPMSALDVNGGVSLGSYAGANAAPSGGLIASGNVGIGTTAPLSALNVAGTTGLTWTYGGGVNNLGLVTIGTGGTSGGSLYVNTASGSPTYQSGLGIDGTYGTPSLQSVINIRALGVHSASGYGSQLAFWTTKDANQNQAMTIDRNGYVGIAKAMGAGVSPQTLLSGTTQIDASAGNTLVLTLPTTGSVTLALKNCQAGQWLVFDILGSGGNPTVTWSSTYFDDGGPVNVGSNYHNRQMFYCDTTTHAWAVAAMRSTQ